ncbi:Hint domain-containing protein [Sphingobium sp. AS12]|uniref:Hint domain-containing protein n=1 Tax=Sphingobium sp. AS12 TaxID=2849495 RepID=UPI001C318700|nr:Hint domain-containing protein [Sphingobium sp. AS12]MBV2150044.1 Hint domain-containing protein [Sphingobium sp. AS12]
MADNPFNIDSLNGVNFSADDVKYFNSSNTDVSGDSRIAPIEANNLPGLSDPGTITVLNNEYTAGFLNEGIPQPNYPQYTEDRYYLPTFGSIQFSNFVDGDGNPITLWIHGFTENGMVLTTNQDAYWFATSGYPLTNLNAGGLPGGIGTQESGLVFGVYGVVDAASGDIPAGAVAVGPETIFDKDPSVFCFAEGTLIATAKGNIRVEMLSVGHEVLTVSGKERPVKWIGRTVARPARHRRPHEVNPVRVRAHAFGPGLPERDLRLSPGHAIYVDGVLVPVAHLVNGATIVQDEVEQIRYFHVELDTHDVLLAEGLPCESYLNDGNRFSALNSGEFTQLYGRIDPMNWDDACAPMVADGPQLTAIQQRLLARAEVLGWARCEGADLVIEADGVTILPEHDEGNRFRFRIPAAERLVLRSASSVLAHVMPGMTDRRRLGVAVSALLIDGEAIALENALFGGGFHPTESHGDMAWRWTDGESVIGVDHRRACTIEIDVAMVAPSWRREAATILSVAA